MSTITMSSASSAIAGQIYSMAAFLGSQIMRIVSAISSVFRSKELISVNYGITTNTNIKSCSSVRLSQRDVESWRERETIPLDLEFESLKRLLGELKTVTVYVGDASSTIKFDSNDTNEYKSDVLSKLRHLTLSRFQEVR